ncbi:hypothetical protein [Kitasatospora sp. NPDC057015]|uniref:hypothetical protein n=1 Tax=Kitasatospora sp. NPDC057015 TaxID=3346001 RepID=UPI0036386825
MGDSPVRRRPWTGGAAAAFSVAALATWSGALPALAEDSRTLFTVTASTTTLVAPAGGDGAYAELPVSFTADDGRSTLTGVRVAVDGRLLAGIAELSLPAPCAFTDAGHLQALCSPGDTTGGGHLGLGVRALPGAPAGAAGQVRFTVTATNATADRAAGRDVTEIRVGDGPQLTAARLPVLTRTTAGAAATLGVALANQGNRDARGVLLWFRIPEGYGLPAALADFDNCTYPAGPAGLVLCRFEDAVVRPGQVLRPSVPVALLAGDGSPEGRFEYGVDVAAGPVDRQLSALAGGGHRGAGAPLGLIAGSGADFAGDSASSLLQADRRHLLAAVAGDLSGLLGTTLPAAFELRNDGDAPLAAPTGPATEGGTPYGLLVSFPQGVRITGAPADCAQRPGEPDVYLCVQTRTLAPGASQDYAFRLVLAELLDRAPGRASVQGPGQAATAAFAVTSSAAPAPSLTVPNLPSEPALRAAGPAQDAATAEPSATPVALVLAAPTSPSPIAQATLGGGLAESGGDSGLSLAATGGLAVGLGLGLIGLAARRHWAGNRG